MGLPGLDRKHFPSNQHSVNNHFTITALNRVQTTDALLLQTIFEVPAAAPFERVAARDPATEYLWSAALQDAQLLHDCFKLGRARALKGLDTSWRYLRSCSRRRCETSCTTRRAPRHTIPGDGADMRSNSCEARKCSRLFCFSRSVLLCVLRIIVHFILEIRCILI